MSKVYEYFKQFEEEEGPQHPDEMYSNELKSKLYHASEIILRLLTWVGLCLFSLVIWYLILSPITWRD